MSTEVLRVKGRRVVLVLDNASWHKTKSLNWHHIEPVCLPAYSPDSNPIEQLRQHLKSHYLGRLSAQERAGIEQQNLRFDHSLLDQPETIRSICRTHFE
jgi:transposase